MFRRQTLLYAALIALPVTSCHLRAQEWPDKVQEALCFGTAEGDVRAQLRGEFSTDIYLGDQYSPGLVLSDRDFLPAPRLVLFADGEIGRRIYFFAQARADRGFDPSDEQADVRLDEYALRYASESGGLTLQAGKFATVFGNWVSRHDPWENPFVGAPLLYENLTHLYDARAVRKVADLEADEKITDYDYNPVIWGPVYSTGAAIAGTAGKLDYAFEIKNAGPSSRPDDWDADARAFDHPALAARLGYRPDMRFCFGVSASESVYLTNSAAGTLAPGHGLGDYRQFLLGQDFSFAWRRLQVWAEVFETRFEIPGLGNADSVAAYIEARYKFTARVFGALRVNGQVFSTLQDTTGQGRWGEDRGRLDLGLIYRFSTQSQIKFQASGNQAYTGEDQEPRITGAAQFLLRF